MVGTVGARVAGETIATAHTTPEASDLQALLARMRDAGVGTVAMEVSSHALDQHRVDGVQFAAVCFTNLSHEHLDYHGSLDAYFEAKARLFARARTPAAAVNVDDERGRELAVRVRAASIDLWTYGVDDASADVVAENIVDDADDPGVHFVLVDRRGGGSVDLHLPLVGRFNVANALAAAATARAAGFELDAVAAGLREPLVVPGRFERIDVGQPFTVLVDYAHTPDALRRVLAAARTLTRHAPTGGWSASSGAGATVIRPSVRSWGRPWPAASTSRC